MELRVHERGSPQNLHPGLPARIEVLYYSPAHEYLVTHVIRSYA